MAASGCNNSDANIARLVPAAATNRIDTYLPDQPQYRKLTSSLTAGLSGGVKRLSSGASASARD